MEQYDFILSRLMKGDSKITPDERAMIEKTAQKWISNHAIPGSDANVVCKILQICNIIYNNASNVLSPLSDDTYDKLIVLCRNANIAYPIGAPPIRFKDNQKSDLLDFGGTYDGPTEVMAFVDKDHMYYFNELARNQFPVEGDYIRDETVVQEYKKQRKTGHTYNLCGTLEKCKFVLNTEAQKAGQLADDSVMIFERDFFGKHIAMGLLNPNNVMIIVSLKYDGISVEATIQGDKIVSAVTRGDTGNDEASDLTPALYGLTFPRATNVIKPTETFGAKFEMIITDKNLALIADKFGKNYVNSRNAIIGLLGNLDARKYRDYLTPVPLESNIPFPAHQIPARIRELEFLNLYYSKGIDMRSIVLQGTYAEVLYKLNLVYHEAAALRGTMGFQYDGIVVEYADERLRMALGKKRSVPNYAIAIKFPPLFRRSTFTHYTYSVGQTGVIVPKAHFLPVEFLGQIHNKTTIHSFKRFKQLCLKPGDTVDLTLNNDVIVYLQKAPDSVQDPYNMNPYEQFPTRCPACGSQLVMSESQDTVYCINFNCPERAISRVSNMLSKLNIKGFSTESIRALKIYNLKSLMNTPREKMVETLGPVFGNQMRDMVEQQLIGLEQPDYRIMGAVGFSGLGSETWKKILRHIQVYKILTASPEELLYLKNISGIGEKTVNTILQERIYLQDDINTILTQMKPILTPINGLQSRGIVRFTGSRDKQLYDLFIKKGFDASLEGHITKDTTILVVPILGYVSSSVEKGFSYLNKRLDSMNAGIHVHNYNDLIHLRNMNLNVTPIILSVEEAYKMLESLV